MGRKGMDINQLNHVMKRCSESHRVRYVTPTIHPRFRQVVSMTIDTANESKVFSITNHPNENFDLYVAVNDYLDSLSS